MLQTDRLLHIHCQNHCFISSISAVYIPAGQHIIDDYYCFMAFLLVPPSFICNIRLFSKLISRQLGTFSKNPNGISEIKGCSMGAFIACSIALHIVFPCSAADVLAY